MNSLIHTLLNKSERLVRLMSAGVLAAEILLITYLKTDTIDGLRLGWLWGGILLSGSLAFLFQAKSDGKRLMPPSVDWRLDELLGRSSINLNRPIVGEQVHNRVVLVTGAAGSIGSELVRQLLIDNPRKLILVDQAESALHDLIVSIQSISETLPGQSVLVPQLADITNVRRMRRLFADWRPELVIHAAAYKHVPMMESHPHEAVRVNVMGTRILADLSVSFGVRTFALVSTDKAVNPTSVMGATKRLAEMYVQSLNGTSSTRFVVTRFGNVLGSSGSVVPLFRQQIAAGGPVTVTHPDIIRYFMTIPEACQLVLEAVAMGRGGEVFVFDMGQPVRIADLARRMIRLSGYKPDSEIKLQFTGLRPGEKLYEELLATNETTLPTHHARIKIARLTSPDPASLHPALARMQQQLPEADADTIVRRLKLLVPEYVNANSPYGRFDRMREVVWL